MSDHSCLLVRRNKTINTDLFVRARVETVLIAIFFPVEPLKKAEYLSIPVEEEPKASQDSWRRCFSKSNCARARTHTAMYKQQAVVASSLRRGFPDDSAIVEAEFFDPSPCAKILRISYSVGNYGIVKKHKNCFNVFGREIFLFYHKLKTIVQFRNRNFEVRRRRGLGEETCGSREGGTRNDEAGAETPHGEQDCAQRGAKHPRD